MDFYFIDLDGTIEDSRLDMALCVNAVRKMLQLAERDVDWIAKHVTKGMDELYCQCFDDLLSQHQNGSAQYKSVFEDIKQKYEAHYFDNVCTHTRCYDGIPLALEKLSKSGKIIVVTNKPEKISRQLLKRLNLDQLITDVMGGDSCPQCKPSPLPLQVAAKRHGFSADDHRAFMIGDSKGDVQAAHAFGARAVWCAWGYLEKLDDSSVADVVVTHPCQLEDLVVV